MTECEKCEEFQRALDSTRHPGTLAAMLHRLFREHREQDHSKTPTADVKGS